MAGKAEISAVSSRATSAPELPGAGKRVGVLALQGDVREHLRVLEELGAATVSVRRPRELEGLDGLVIPGGESSVMDKLARAFDLFEPLRDALRAGLPAYGTCAGLIMLSDRVLDGIAGQQSLGGLDISVRRNAFGAQVDSFEEDLAVPLLGDEPVHAVFIRAPLVDSLGAGPPGGPAPEAIATLADGRVVAVRQGRLLGTSFHPEVTDDHRFHAYFLRELVG